MASSKKYTYQVSLTGDSWVAEIVRQVNKNKTHVSKQQTGFSSEAEAQSWAEQELTLFVEQQVARNKRKAEKR